MKESEAPDFIRLMVIEFYIPGLKKILGNKRADGRIMVSTPFLCGRM